MFKILVSDKLAQEGLNLLKQAGDVDLTVKTGMTPEELAEFIAPFDGLVIRSASKVTAEVLKRADNLKVIARAGVGVDNVDKKAATERGIIVMNTPGGNTISTAEHTMALLFSLVRNVPAAVASLKGGQWDRNKYTGMELNGKTIGIIGLGRIGTEVARRCQAFNMQVIGYDPFTSDEKARSLSIEPLSLEELYRRADVITLHVPITDETRGMIGAGEIALMKPGVRIINCARGGLLDDQAVREALDAGKIAGVGVDVYPTEPPAPDYPLIDHPAIVCTPHLGASTEDAQVNVAVEVVEQMLDALRGNGVRNAVNMPYVDPKTMEQLGPFIQLGDRLGQLLSQLATQKPSCVEITYSGELTQFDLGPVTNAVLRGFMAARLQEQVNFVNARTLAENHGLKVVASTSSGSQGYTNLIHVAVQAADRKYAAAGTIYREGHHPQRIVMIDDRHLEAPAQGHLLVIWNRDKPGVIGTVGTAMGKRGINISYMSFADMPGSEDAVATVNISKAPGQDAIEEMRQNEDIKELRVAHLGSKALLVFIDNYDSFTYNLVQYFGEQGAQMQVFRNDAIDGAGVAALRPTGVVISPGPCTPSQAGNSCTIIETMAEKAPILGVCLGHQCIGQVFGGTVSHAPTIMHGKFSQVLHEGEGLFESVPSPFKVTRYHSLVVQPDDLPECLRVTARTEDGVIMGIQHQQLPVYGVQFHPESIFTEHGKQIITNFLKICSHAA